MSSHNMTKEQYLQEYPGNIVVSEEVSERGREISKISFLTEESKRKATDSKRKYWENITEEEKSQRVKGMITYKRSKEGRNAMRPLARSLAHKFWNDDKYEESRKKLTSYHSNKLKELWKDSEYRKFRISKVKGRVITEKEREVRKRNMLELNKKIYLNQEYRAEVCSPLWGKGGIGPRGGTRVKYVSKSKTLYVFRSLWELTLALILDQQDILWEYESLSIPYENSIYIPDFYLPNYNLVLEVKPTKFLDDICKLKRGATEDLGYYFSYMTEKELPLNELNLMNLTYSEDQEVLYTDNLQRLSKGCLDILGRTK